jgi:hypothetical protein
MLLAVVCMLLHAAVVHADGGGNDFNGVAAAADAGFVPLSFGHSARSSRLPASDAARVYTEAADIGMNDDSYFFAMILYEGEKAEDVLFEAALFDTASAVPALAHSPDYPWIAKSGYVTSGNAGAHGSVSRLSAEAEHGKSIEVYFEWYAGSETEADVFSFLIDGKKALRYSGTGMNDYASFSHVLSPGRHALVWEYSKDSSDNIGLDGVRVRNLKINYMNAEVPSSDFIITADRVLAGYIGAGGDVAIPAGVEKIAGGVFAGNSAVKSLVISGSVKTIETQAFQYCDSLTSVFIPASVEQIGAMAFYGTVNLSAVRVEHAVPLPLGDRTNIFTPCDDKTLVVPDGSKAAYTADPEWSKFARIVEESENAFAEAVFDSASVRVEFVHSADYPWIAEISENSENAGGGFVTNGNKKINGSKSSFTALLEHDRDIEASFEYFAESESFDHFEFRVNEKTIFRLSGTGMSDYESYSFSLPPGKHELTWEYAKDSRSSAGFDGAKVRNLKVTYTGATSPLSEFLVRDGVLLAYFGKGGNVHIPDNVTDIAESVFEGNGEIVSAFIPGSVRNINNYVFRNCDSLTSVVVSDGIRSIGMEAFLGAPLTVANIPASLVELSARAFGGNSALASIDVDSGNTKYISENGVLYDRNRTHLIQYPAAKSDTSFTIPASVGTIESYAFEGNSTLREITVLRDSIVPVAFNGFNPGNCILRVPAGKKELYETSAGWKDFKRILYAGEDPDGASFESALLDSASVVPAFEHSSDYPWVSKTGYAASGNGRAPSSVSYFAAEVEHDKSIEVSFDWLASSEAQRDVFSFRIDGKTALQSSGIEAREFSSFVHVLAPGKHVLRWEYAKDEATDTGLDEAQVRRLKITYLDTVAPVSEFIIDASNVLVGYTGAGGDITIPEGAVKIAANVFAGNSGIRSVVVSGTVVEIERNAFMNCDSLAYVFIPASVERIGLTAFYGTANLREVKVERAVPLPLSEDLNIFYPCAASLIVPRGTADVYAQAPVWRKFPNIIVPDTIMVVFNSNGGVPTMPDTVFAVHNAILTPPSEPTHAKYAFKGWYREPEGLAKWNFDTDRVAGSMELYARWGVPYNQEISFARGSSDSVEFNIRATSGKTFTVLCGGVSRSYAGTGDNDVRVTGKGGSVKIVADEDCDFLRLDASKQSLISLDVSKSPLLLSLNCRDNSLQTLNVDSNTELLDLNCRDNNISALDISNNTALVYLDCSGNRIENLDVSKNPDLRKLVCSDNSISSLDLSANAALEEVYCYNNSISLAGLYDISKRAAAKASLGKQTLPESRVGARTAIPLDTVFKGRNTAVEVFDAADAILVDEDYYTFDKGVLRFLTGGAYYVETSNPAIVSDTAYPAKTVARFIVSDSASSDATLKRIDAGGGVLSPEFNPAVLNYSMEVAARVETFTARGYPNHPRAVVSAAAIDLAIGENGRVWPLKVTAENGKDTLLYTVTINRISSDASGNARLKSLAASRGNMSPAFSPDIFEYTVKVTEKVDSISLRGIAAHEGASVSNNGFAALEYLTPGNANAVSFTVVAEDRASAQTYSVIIDRAVPLELKLNGRNLEELGAEVTEVGPDETLISYVGDCDIASGSENLRLNITASEGSMKVTAGGKDGISEGSALSEEIEVVPGKLSSVKIEASANAGGGKHTYIFEAANPIVGENLYYSRWNNVIAVNRNSINNVQISEVRWRDKNNVVTEREYVRLTGSERPADYKAEIKTVETNAWHKVCSNVETKSYAKFAAYPNPVSRGESLILQMPESFVGGTLDVYSLSGQIVKSGVALTSAMQAVSVADLITGIYIFHATAKTGEKREVRIIVE